MPDHFRAQVDAMGPPGSPAGSDSPLSLVMKKDREHVMGRRHDELMIQLPGSPSRSSGFSENDDTHHLDLRGVGEASHDGAAVVQSDHQEEVGNLVVALEEEQDEDDNVPLALVVAKHYSSSDESGHGTDESRQKSSYQECVDDYDRHSQNRIKIRDFAKYDLAIPGPSQRHLQDQPVNMARMSPPGHHRPSESDDSDSVSDLSSTGTWESEVGQDGVRRSYPCRYCDKVFQNHHQHTSHLVTHTGERNFTCRKCAKSFGRKSTLRAHMTTHTGTSNFMCPMCDKACNDNNSLEEHIRMHTGEKPFVCTICSKAYARKSHLNVHYRVHTGERPFVCNECGKDFTEKRFLNDHVQTAHNGQEGPLKCPNCFREFAYKTSLKQHLKKQMCVKNLNRGQGCQGHGPHPKQFACPFCEKSYSWKQTLKQHVSMYHRNKVHTDEFWKYELAKHRRTVLDTETNEDMWQRQLGKHAMSVSGESVTNCQGSRQGSLLHEIDPNHEDKWLDQIKRSTETKNQADIKMLALRSLGSSMQYMQATSDDDQRRLRPPAELPKLPQVRDEGYLALLANVSYNRMESEQPTAWQGGEAGRVSTAPQWEHLRDIKEEPAAKRTQMWLAQLGQYQQRAAAQEDGERQRDDLWEEQIARIKRAPSKAGTDQVEITIDDDDEEAQDRRPPTVASARPPAVLPLMMSALQVRPPPQPLSGVAPHHLTVTLHQGEGVQERISPRKVPAFLTEENNNNNNNNNNNVINNNATRHVPLAPPPTQQRSLPIPIPRSSRSSEESFKSQSPSSCGDSVLKSLLLDPASRKRPISPPPRQAPSPKARFVPDDTDILRRRLLGLKHPELQPVAKTAALSTPQKFPPPTATATSPPEPKCVEPAKEEDKAAPAATQTRSQNDTSSLKDSYKKTSVLKHLLYRYTTFEGSADNLKKDGL